MESVNGFVLVQLCGSETNCGASRPGEAKDDAVERVFGWFRPKSNAIIFAWCILQQSVLLAWTMFAMRCVLFFPPSRCRQLQSERFHFVDGMHVHVSWAQFNKHEKWLKCKRNSPSSVCVCVFGAPVPGSNRMGNTVLPRWQTCKFSFEVFFSFSGGNLNWLDGRANTFMNTRF